MTIIVALLFTSSFSFFVPGTLSAPHSASEYSILTESTPEVIERRVRIYFSDIPVMKEIAWCESRFRHYGSNGEVLRGEVEPTDIGVMQINEYFHGDTADRLGIDIHDFGGNLLYARYLYEKEGTRPWKSSQKCWGDQVAMK